MNKVDKVPVLEKVDRCEIDTKKLWCSRTKYPDREEGGQYINT